MKYVERIYPGFQWAKPLHGKDLDVVKNGLELQITGSFPDYREKDSPCDLVRQYENFPKQLATGQQSATEAPDMRFANADTDEKLIAFVRRFGPVVAKSVGFKPIDFEEECTPIIPKDELGKPRSLGQLIAKQEMRELRNEHAVYRAALNLVMRMKETKETYDYDSAQQLIKVVAEKIKEWPEQWERENLLRGDEPKWKLSEESLKRVSHLSSAPPNPLLPDELTGRIVICELLNSFRSIVFPNPLEMHSSIKFGIRPLLYSILRRQFIYPRGFSICSNSECRDFFNIERAGQQFCSPDCSRHQRQRDYWKNRGKKLRKKRAAKRRRPRK